MIRRNLPKILIADDHTLVAEACKKLLEGEYEVVGTVSDGRSLVRAAVELRPHLIIVDVAMPQRATLAEPSAGFTGWRRHP